MVTCLRLNYAVKSIFGIVVLGPILDDITATDASKIMVDYKPRCRKYLPCLSPINLEARAGIVNNLKMQYVFDLTFYYWCFYSFGEQVPRSLKEDNQGNPKEVHV